MVILFSEFLSAIIGIFVFALFQYKFFIIKKYISRWLREECDEDIDDNDDDGEW